MALLNREEVPIPESERVLNAKAEIEKLGFSVALSPDCKSLTFTFKNQTVILFPYTGWHTGMTLKDGRGLKNLLKQLK